MNRESIDSLARRLAASLPQGLKAVRDDVEANFRSVLQAGLARMDLVTREEFEVQELVLARSREKLEALERRVAAYEEAQRAAASAPATEPGPGAAAATGANPAHKARRKAGKKPAKKAGKKAGGKKSGKKNP